MREIAMRRRALLLAASLLPGCSVLPDRPFQEAQRYGLAPRRPGPEAPAGRGAPVLLVRGMRAAPGLDQRGLRTVGAGGRVEVAYWDEWAARPAEAAEEALRRWMSDSGLFSAVVAPGSRLDPDVVMESELIRLEAAPADGVARAALSVLVLSDPRRDPVGEARILGQLQVEGSAQLPGGAEAPAGATAAAMEAALGEALARLEAALRPLLARTRVAAPSRRG
jgi:ABC-type uncharacterized transport system auxiliary subunit